MHTIHPTSPNVKIEKAFIRKNEAGADQEKHGAVFENHNHADLLQTIDSNHEAQESFSEPKRLSHSGMNAYADSIRAWNNFITPQAKSKINIDY